MRRILKIIGCLCCLFAAVFFVGANKSTQMSASANVYDDLVIETFSDNENLADLITNNIELDSSFNVLNYTNLVLYDQSPYGTCYATSLAQTINLCYEYRTGEYVRVSAAALALQLKNLFFNEGSYCAEIVENSYNLDYVSEFDFPYELSRLYYEDLFVSNKVVDLNFEEKEILDVEEYYVFPTYISSCTGDVQDQYVTALKKALVRDGALAMGFNFYVAEYGDYLIYDSSFVIPEPSGHAMTIIGYDDNFSASNFYTRPSRDGAFILLNSWGTGEQIVYMSYDDVLEMHFIYGIAGFVDVDERAETIANIDTAYYEMTTNFSTETLTENVEVGYQFTNSTDQAYLTQIDLQPFYNTETLFNLYFDATDIKIYLNASNDDLNFANQLIGEYDISAGVNKIRLSSPVLVGNSFAIKIKIDDERFTYGYFDRQSLNVQTLFNSADGWQTESYSNNNYNLIKTPFYIRLSLSDSSVYDISEESNYQTATTNAVVFDLSSNVTITDVDVEIYRYKSASISFSSYDLTIERAESLFDVNASVYSVSIQAQNFIQGTFKVVITVNGEKQFIKFLRFDDGIVLTTMFLDIKKSSTTIPIRLYDTTLGVEKINVTIPSSYYMKHTQNLGLEFILEDIFDYDETTTTITDSYSIDIYGRIAKATIVFENEQYHTQRTIVFNFAYETRIQIVYVTNIPNATHSNQQFVAAGVSFTLKNASATNYIFKGWFTDAEYVSQIYQIPALAEGQIVYIYAKFEEKTFDCVVKKITYNEETNIMTLLLNFEEYNLSIYDVIEFTGISHKFKSEMTPVSFSILKTNQYSYQFYIDPLLKNKVNTIEFEVKIKRFAYRDYFDYFPHAVLTQIVSVSDMLKITLGASENGKVYNVTNINNPTQLSNGDIYVPYGGFLSLRFDPNENCYISQIMVDGVLKQDISNDFYMSNITSNHTIAVKFVATSYDIITTVVGNGSINHGFTETVKAGSSITYTFTPDEGAYFVSVVVDGVTITNVTSYTFDNVQDNHRLTVNFANYKFTLQTTIVGEGSIGQPNTKTVDYGSTVTYEFKANEGYTLVQIKIDGEEVELTNDVPFVYVFENVKQTHTIYVVFQKNQINISVFIIGNGNVSIYNLADLSSNLQTVQTSYSFELKYGDGLKFVSQADLGNKISNIKINGINQTVSNEFIKENIIEDLNVEVTFEIQKFKLTLTINGSGYSNQLSNIEVGYGDDIEYEFIPTVGYEVSSVKVNGYEQGKLTILNITNITENKVIVVNFSIQVFEIKWFNYNEVLIAITEVNYGTQPVATFAEPSKAGSGIYVYKFIGWNTEIDGSGSNINVATADVSYYAQYETRFIEFEIKASSASNGLISPSGNIKVEYGKKQTFEMIPDSGYHVYRVYVDGKIIENIENYTFENVKESHTISVTFKRNDYRAFITNNDDKGEIVGNKWFESGERAIYKINPKEGYDVKRVVVNGKEVVLTNNSFVIESVSEELNIVVEYEKDSSGSAFGRFKNFAVIAIVVVAIAGAGSAAFIVFKKFRERKLEQDEYE